MIPHVNAPGGRWAARAAAVAAVVAVLLVQRGILSHWPLWGVRADLPQAVAIVFGLLRGRRWGAGFGLAFGLLADVQDGVLIGAQGLVAAAGGYTAGWVATKVFRDTILVPVAAAAAISLFCQCAYIAIANAFGLGLPWRDGLWQVALPTAVFNAALVPFLYPLCLRLCGRMPQEEPELPFYGSRG